MVNLSDGGHFGKARFIAPHSGIKSLSYPFHHYCSDLFICRAEPTPADFRGGLANPSVRPQNLLFGAPLISSFLAVSAAPEASLDNPPEGPHILLFPFTSLTAINRNKILWRQPTWFDEPE
jgi:hypothetical protein